MPGTLFVVATPIGNLEDISTRALRTLREVALIAAEDTRRTAHLLSRYSINTPTTSVHEHNELQKTTRLVARLMHGDDIALVSDAGTPVVSDPGQHLIRAAIDAGIRIEPIPGPSAVLAALTASGFGGGTFTFLGFPPIRSKDRIAWFECLSQLQWPVVFFEAPHRIEATLQELLQKIGDRPAVLCREMTKTYESLVRGPISALVRAVDDVKGEITVVVDMGQRTAAISITPISDRDLALEFGEITKIDGL